MPPDRRVHVGVCAIVERGDQVLLLQRGGASGYAVDGVGTWGAPGGWLELGETPDLAAVRETPEETGVVVEPSAHAGWTHNWRESGDEQIVTLHVRCRWVAGEPAIMEPEKCPRVEWVPIDRVASLPLFAPLVVWWREHVHELAAAA